MKLPGGVFLLVLGLLMLWLAITGRLDRIAGAYEYLKGNTDTLASGTVGGSTGGTVSLVDPSAWHVGEIVAALPSIVDLSTGFV